MRHLFTGRLAALPTQSGLLRRARSLRAALLAALLLGAGGPTAAETLAQALADLDQHGYASPLLAIGRLQAVTDRPGTAAPLEQQLHFHARLALFALHGKYKKELAAELAELKRLTDTARCAQCGPYLLTLQLGQAEINSDSIAVKPLVDRLAALPAQADLHFEAERLTILARARALLNDEDRALRTGLQAVETAGRARLPAIEARTLCELVRLHLVRGDAANAARIGDDCYALAERIGFRFLMAHVRINQSYAYGNLKQTAKEHQSLLDVLSIANGTPGTEALEQFALSNLAAYHVDRGEYALAIRHALAAETLARRIGDDIGVVFALTNRGSALARSGRVDEGIALLEQGVKMAEQTGERRATLDMLTEKVNVLDHAGRHREALDALRRVVELSGAIVSAEREKTALELQEKFLAERKTREIERLSLSNARAQAEVSARAWQQRLWVVLAAVVLLSAALLAWWLRTVRRRNQALVVDNAALTSQLSHDPLTGAFNRRHFEQLMVQQEALIEDAAPSRKGLTSVGLVLLDVDHFKRINDTHGHAAGDEVLKAVVARLRGLVRGQDAVVRWGGEEFVLVLPGISSERLAAVAAKALRVLGRKPVMYGDVAIPVRASAGTVAWPAWPGQCRAEAMHLADLALYISKTAGRNRATCVKSVRAGADPGRVASDLVGAAAVGDVTLKVMPGPA